MANVFEEELKSNPFLRCMYENSKVNAMLIMDEEGYILHLNDAFHHSYGYTITDLQGKQGRVLYTREDQQKGLPEKEIKAVIQLGMARDRNYIVHRDGICIWTDGESVLTRSANGASLIMKTIQNIHEQKITENFLRESRVFSESIIDSISDGLLVIDREQRILKANRRFYQIMDREEADVEGLFLSQLETQLLAINQLAGELHNVMQESAVSDAEFEHLSKEGNQKRIIHVKARFLTEERQGSRILLLFRDVTAYKKKEENEQQIRMRIEEMVTQRTGQLLEANFQLQSANGKLEEFAHASSHDLKEPIRKINVYLSYLKTKIATRLTQEEMRLLEGAENSASRMMLLVEDLLKYTGITQDLPKMEQVDLNEKMKVILEDLEVPIQNKKAIIKIDPLPVIIGYRRQIRQLFQNLISNALKFSKENMQPEIRITSKKLKGGDAAALTNENDQNREFYLVQISDNGIGFDQTQTERIFKAFYRLHGKNAYEGTGLGLAIVRKIVENHKGYIGAESESGKGAAFNVLLPVDQELLNDLYSLNVQ